MSEPLYIVLDTNARNIGKLLSNSPHAVPVNVTTNWLLIPQDPDDDKFVDCAIAGRANYVVTNDKHFNVLKDVPFPPLKVLNIDTFLEIVLSLD